MKRNLTAESIRIQTSKPYRYQGEVPVCVRTEITNTLPKGHSNLAKAAGRKKFGLPVATGKLREIRENLKKSNLNSQERSLWWLAGSFRIHEFLAQEPETFDPTSLLLSAYQFGTWRDL